MRVNFVYHNPIALGSGYFGSEGLKRALDKNDLLEYAYCQNKDDLDVDRLKSNPIFFVRGFLEGRMPIVARSGNQFKACWQSESFYTRHGEKDGSTDLCLKNQKFFDMIFTSSDVDMDKYDIPTYFLPSWADTQAMDEYGEPEYEGLGFVGGREGREDFLNQDKEGIINQKKTILYRGDPFKTTQALAKLISKFKMLVSPPGRCFSGMCGRAWEIMVCKRLCFQYLNEDTMYRTAKMFRDGIDIVYFKTYDELLDKYKYYLDHPDQVERIAYNGYEVCRLYHNEDVRAKYVIQCMTIQHAKWKKYQANIPDIINEVYNAL